MDIVSILQIGTVGLGFLLAYFAFRLLRKEQEKAEPRVKNLRATYTFMLFSLLLVILGGAFEVVPQFINDESAAIQCSKNQCIRSDGNCGSVKLSAGAIYVDDDAQNSNNACCTISQEQILPNRWEASDLASGSNYEGNPRIKVRVMWECLP